MAGCFVALRQLHPRSIFLIFKEKMKFSMKNILLSICLLVLWASCSNDSMKLKKWADDRNKIIYDFLK